MEHRHTKRKSLAVDVMVSCSRVGMVRGQTVDISAGGMFVNSECVTVPRHAPVTVSFQPDGEHPLVCFKARAMVIHQDENGFGLMFDDLEPECERALSEILAKSASSEEVDLPVGAAIVA